MKTWTIKIDERLDRLVEQLIDELGYTSKAEFVRESIRQQILEVGLSKLDIQVPDRHATSNLKIPDAFQHLLELSINDKDLKELISKARDELEQVLYENQTTGT